MKTLIVKEDVLAKLERYCEAASCEENCDFCDIDYAKDVVESMDEYVFDDIEVK